jgi:hypothetical protein
MTTEHKPVATNHDAFHGNIVVTPLRFIHSAAPAAVCPITTTYYDKYHLTDTLMTQLPMTYLLLSHPKALGEVATTIGDSATTFTDMQGDTVAYACHHVHSQYMVDLLFEIMVYGVYGVAGFLSFLR